eukprot:TRINITY_DN33_c1_g1_i1.p1 TRINITY_DN33_c1_g1~~TRINITY_DN33_c1_g1_i1.p1  ORF type:complete len:1307 (-),score=335.20 TRINITY_DN33_c1_g1_i1:1236-5156(-)
MERRRESVDSSSGSSSTVSASSSSASSTGSTGSTSSGTSQLGITEAALNRAREFGLSLLLFATTRGNVAGRFFLAVPINLICFIQLLSFTVDPRSRGQWPNNDAVRIIQIVLCAPRTWSATSSGERQSVAIITYILTSVVSSLAALILALHMRHRLRRGRVSILEEQLTLLCNFGVEIVGTVLFLPCMHHALSSLVCSDVNCQIFQRVCGGVLATECVIVAFANAVAQNEILAQSRHFFACCLTRVEMLRACATAVASICYHVTSIGDVPQLVRPLAVSGVIAAYACLGVVLIALTWPYYRRFANHWRMGEYAALAAAATFGAAGALAPHAAGIGLFAVWCASVPVAATIGVVASAVCLAAVSFRLRRRVIDYIIAEEKRGSLDMKEEQDEDDEEVAAAAEAGGVPLLQNFYSVSLATMHVFWQVLRSKELTGIQQEVVLDRLSQILLMSMAEKKAKCSAYNEAMYCLFTMNTSTELQHLFVHLKRAFSKHPWPDVYLLLLRVDEHRRDIIRSLDKGAEEIQQGITEADKFTQKAAELLRKFWLFQLTGKYTQLLTVVAELDRCEHRILDIFNVLQAKYPKSVKVMRQRAKFVDEIFHDGELARILLTAADEIEEQEARSRHKRHRHSLATEPLPPSSSGMLGPHHSAKVAPADSADETSGAAVPEPQSNVKFDLGEFNEKQQQEEEQTAGNRVSTDGCEMTEAADVAVVQQHAATAASARYRLQAIQLRSRAFVQLFVATWLIMGILLANVVVSYTFVKNGFSKVVTAYDSMTEASAAHAYAPDSVIQIENLLTALIVNDSTAAATARSSMVNASNTWLELEHNLYKKSARKQSISQRAFTDKDLNCSVYNTMSRTHTYAACSLHELVSEMTLRMGALAEDPEVVDRDSFLGSADARYILDNSPFVARPALDALVVGYEDDVLGTLKQAETILISLLPCTVVVVVACLAVFFVRSVLLLRVERLNVLQLFASIPPQAAERVYVECGGRRADAAERVAAAAVARRRYGQRHQEQQGVTAELQLELPLRFLLGVLLVAALSLALTLMGLFEMRGRHVTTKYTSALFSEKTILRRQHALAVQYANEDLSFYVTMDNMRYQMELAVHTFGDIQSKADGLLGDMPYYYKDDALVNMVYNRNCSNILGLPAATCEGVFQLDSLYTSNVVAFKETPDANVTYSSDHWLALSALESGPIRSWHAQYESDTLALLRRRRERALAMLLALFCAAWPAALIAYALIHVPLQKIRQDHQYTVRMFLLIPPDLIEQLPQIKEYLETGRRSNRAREMQRALQDSISKTEQILQNKTNAP